MSKTILITGATDGIGFETAKMLAAEGNTILLHGRNKDKLQSVALQIGRDTQTYLADMSSLDDVDQMAKAILKKHDKIDIIINNAGIFKTPVTTTKDGLDTRFMVNTIAPYALTQQLLPIMPEDGRVINLSSAAQAPVDIDALKGGVQLDAMSAYAQSKLAITIWTQELAKEMPNGPVFVAVNPGSLLASKMVKEGFGVEGHDLSIGADILRRAALSDEFAYASGKYFDNDARRFASPERSALNVAHSQAIVEAIKSIIAQLRS